MRRREFIALVGGTAVAWPFATRAQQTTSAPHRLPRKFHCCPRSQFDRTLFATVCASTATRKAVTSRSITAGQKATMSGFPTPKELVALKVDLIVTAGTPAAQAVERAGTSIPLVMVAVGDPDWHRSRGSLARPGGNNTGLNSLAPELEGKRLDLLKETVPNLTYIAVLWNRATPTWRPPRRRCSRRQSAAYESAFLGGAERHRRSKRHSQSVLQEQPNALNVMADRLFLHNRTRIMDFALQHRLPGVHAYRELVLSGGLMSYG